jgi:hypothetical protein
MPQKEQLRSVCRSIANHAVSGLSGLHPHVIRACRRARSRMQVDLLMADPCPPEFAQDEALRLSLKGLRENFEAILAAEGISVADLTLATLDFEVMYPDEDYRSCCHATLQSENHDPVEYIVDYRGQTYAPLSTPQPTCNCFDRGTGPWQEVRFHQQIQDTDCEAWKRLTDLVEQAAFNEREEFAPFRGMDAEKRAQIVTLPPSIAKLRSVRHLLLYGSFLVRIPREIGSMTSLEKFTPYTSWRLHWLPYEITRCKNLVDSSISTRCLYGNFKHRPPFPALPVSNHQLEAITDCNLHADRDTSIRCSVCDKSCVSQVKQVWISLRVATDDVPLLVNACSQDCIDALPTPRKGYVPYSHTGGLNLRQPPAQW